MPSKVRTHAKGRCNPNLRKDPIPSAVLFLFEGKKPLLLADPAPGQGNNDQAQGERPSDLYGTDGTASLTACAASIDTSESWVCCRGKDQPRILPLNAICSRIGRGVTGQPCTGGQNHAYERRDFAPYGYCFCQIDTPHASPLSFNSFDRSYKLGKGDGVGGGGLFQWMQISKIGGSEGKRGAEGLSFPKPIGAGADNDFHLWFGSLMIFIHLGVK